MCIFCEIVNGNIPSKKVYEDENFLAILDLSQTTYGHTLVMPKKHYDNFLDMPANEAGKLMEVVNIVANKIYKNLNCNGCNILMRLQDKQLCIHMFILFQDTMKMILLRLNSLKTNLILMKS